MLLQILRVVQVKHIVKMLLQRDDVAADSKSSADRTPLSFAAVNGHESIVKMLLWRDDVAADSKSSEGQTPLSFAAEYCHM